MRTWHKLSERHINVDTDCVINVFEKEGEVVATYRIPLQSEIGPASFEDICELIGRTILPPDTELVVTIDEDELWNDRWGNLIDHPTRGTKLQTKPFSV